MERNSDDLAGAGSTGMGNAGTSGYAGGSASGTTGSSMGSDLSDTASSTMDNVADRARDVAGTAKDKLADVGSTVRDKAGSAKNSLADALESGAEKLRQRAQSGQLSGATGAGSVAVSDNRVGQMADRLAGGMQASADWLRDADLDNLRSGVERQVREHPGRTLLVAVGLGYLIGKAFRK